MGIASIVLFFLYFWGFGFGLLKALKAKEAPSFLERQIMRAGIGAGALILTAMILNIVNVPLDWKVFLALALLAPVIYLSRSFKHLKAPKPSLRKSDIAAIAVILIFAGSLYMYASGALSYPWLEDDDPWSHASGIKYVSVEKTLDQSPYRGFQYMNPYPPAYDFLIGLMHQTESSLSWTMKFFNALIVSLSLLFFYFFAKEFTRSSGKALFATAVLAAVPAYQSHFIWAPALAMMLFPVALYSLEMIKHDKKWKFIAAVAIGAMLVSHPTHSLTLFSMIAIYIIVKIIAEKDVKTYLAAGICGVAASLSWWGVTWKSFFRANIVPSTQSIGQPVAESAGLLAKILGNIPKVFNKWSGTASRPYHLQDFFVASSNNMINNPIGFGIVACILTIIGLFFAVLRIAKLAKGSRFVNRENAYLIITLLWLVLTFVIVNNLTFNLPLGFYAFRTWMILAVPVAIIAAEGLWGLFAVLSSLKLEKTATAFAKIAVVSLVVGGLWFTSAEQKYELNTRQWYYSGAFWTSPDEMQAYVWMKTLPADTKVFSFLSDDQVTGMDKLSCGWCREVAEYRKTGFNDTAKETAWWMKSNGYEYMVIGGREASETEFGAERVNAKLNELAGSGLFQVVHQTNSAIILKTT